MEEKGSPKKTKKKQQEERKKKKKKVCSGNKNKSFKKDRSGQQSQIPLRIQERRGLKK